MRPKPPSATVTQLQPAVSRHAAPARYQLLTSSRLLWRHCEGICWISSKQCRFFKPRSILSTAVYSRTSSEKTMRAGLPRRGPPALFFELRPPRLPTPGSVFILGPFYPPPPATQDTSTPKSKRPLPCSRVFHCSGTPSPSSPFD